MTSSAIICMECRRVVAIGATLPATCLAAVSDEDRRRLPGTDLDTHPAAHRSCVELEVIVPPDLDGEALLESVGRAQQEAIEALAGLVEIGGGGPGA